MSVLINYRQINIKNKHLVGNKAFNLAFLVKRSVKTANFFVIPTSVFEKFARPRSVVLPKILQREILENADKLKTNRFAVRSSATCEDGENSSFAGQFESYLSVSKNQLLDSIKKCWQSVYAEQVKTYCLYHQIDHSSIKMAVIVQEMIFAEKGGVIFTKDIFQNRNNLIIEAARELGENIVSGLVNPERISFPKDKQHSRSKTKILTEDELETLYIEGLKIEKIFGKPQDIEWAIEKNNLYILQTRPITI